MHAWESIILVKVKDILYDMEENISNNTENFSKELESFIKYVDSTWIGERNSRKHAAKEASLSSQTVE